MLATRTNEAVPELSVVVPVYNEEGNVGPLCDRIRVACESLGRSYEAVFVDDGSRDGTFAILESIHKVHPAVRVIRFRRNHGQTAALAAGFAYAQGKIIVSMDGDLQNDPADIGRLVQKIEEGYDVVCGWRKDRKDKLVSRRVPSMVANWLIRRISGVSVHDTGCALKAFRGPLIKQVPLYADLHRFLPAMAVLAGGRIAEIVVTHHARRSGTSKYGISRAVKVALDVVAVKMLIAFAARPAAAFGLLGVASAAVGVVCAVWALAFGLWGVLPTVALLCFSLTGHLVMVAVLSEMVLQTGDFRPDRILSAVAARAEWASTPGIRAQP